jgi:hypothetical protein
MDTAERYVCAKVNPGICGLVSQVQAGSADGMQVTVRIESDCPRVQAYAAAWAGWPQGATLDALEELLRKPLVETTPARLAAEQGLHPSCPVPIAVLKASEVVAGLALPCDCNIELAVGGKECG